MYQPADHGMGRSTLGAFRSIPQSTVSGVSALTPARALLNHRQARSTRCLYAKARDGERPEVILTRGRLPSPHAYAQRRCSAGECQSRPLSRCRPSVSGRDRRRQQGGRPPEGLRTASASHAMDRRRRNRKRGAGCGMCLAITQWAGRLFHLPINKEVFDSETFFIFKRSGSAASSL